MATEPNNADDQLPRRKYPHAPQPTGGATTAAAPVGQSSDAKTGLVRAKSGEDSRERARKRAEELRDHLGTMDEGTDDFFIDKRVIPEGWAYEWKRHTTLGAEDPAYQVQIARAGWESVPADRHPEMMPDKYEGGTILRKGMILMERPLEINDEVKAIELRKARAQVRQKEIQLRGSPAGDNSPFDPTNKGNPLVNIKKSYEPMPIPKE